VVLGELFGLTDVQREAAERVAALGYVAIAPDLLHRRGPAARSRRTTRVAAQGCPWLANSPVLNSSATCATP